MSLFFIWQKQGSENWARIRARILCLKRKTTFLPFLQLLMFFFHLMLDSFFFSEISPVRHTIPESTTSAICASATMKSAHSFWFRIIEIAMAIQLQFHIQRIQYPLQRIKIQVFTVFHMLSITFIIKNYSKNIYIKVSILFLHVWNSLKSNKYLGQQFHMFWKLPQY